MQLEGLILVGVVAIVLFGTLIWFASRYKRCPSDKILVVYGKVSGGKAGQGNIEQGHEYGP